MGNTNDKFAYLAGTQSAIKSAIVAQGVPVPSNTTFREYASKVGLIGFIGTGTYLVRYFDFDGTLLKQQRVNTGQNATPPSNPIHNLLTFSGWNNPSVNITANTDIGAIYSTTDGKTYLFITIPSTTGVSPTLYLNKTTSDLMTIAWGDGQTSTSSAIGNISIPHTYAAIGNYTITISCAGEYTFGNGIAGALFTGTYNSILTLIYIGANVTVIQDYSFKQQYSLKTITIPQTVTSINSQAFNTCRWLAAIILPSSITTVAGNAFNNCSSLECVVIGSGAITFPGNSFASCTALKSIIIPPLVTALGATLFSSCYLLKSVVLPSSVTSIGASAFSGCSGLLEMVVLNATPPTLGDTNIINGVSVLFKCYVPDASVTAYKTATNWNSISWCIYPLSTRL